MESLLMEDSDEDGDIDNGSDYSLMNFCITFTRSIIQSFTVLLLRLMIRDDVIS
jgi:hypothetical protein